MSLVKCKECGKTISNKTSRCIHCGHPVKKFNLLYLLGVIPILLIITIIIVCSNNNSIYKRIVNNSYTQNRGKDNVYSAYGTLTFYDDYTGIFSYKFDIDISYLDDVEGETKFEYSINEDDNTIEIVYQDSTMKLSDGNTNTLKYDKDTDCMYVIDDTDNKLCKE